MRPASCGRPRSARRTTSDLGSRQRESSASASCHGFLTIARPHSWTYVLDVVTALEIAGRDERAWGRAWHVPTAPPSSVRAMVAGLARAGGLDAPAVRRLPWGVLGAAGLVVADIREIREIAYQFDAPFVVDSTAFATTFASSATETETALVATIEWWRRRRGFPLTSLQADALASR